MVINVSGDVDDMFNRIKKFFNIDADMFDFDMFFIPEMNESHILDPESENPEAFKVSYHFESGMEEPDVKIETNFNREEIEEYMKKLKASNDVRIQEVNKPIGNMEIDAYNLSLENQQIDTISDIIEPYTEITDFDTFTEVLIEIPGVKKENISFSFNEEGTILTFFAEKDHQDYLKDIYLSFKSSRSDTKLEINNGLVIIKVSRSE